MQEAEIVQLLEDAFGEVFQDLDTDAVDRYFHPAYEQTTNGEHLDRTRFVHHVQALADQYESIHVLPFDEIVVAGDRAATRYTVEATARDGTHSRVLMAAFWTLRDGKIGSCWEIGVGG
ncbi:MAG: nuclear transport factor 2 family protein [Acidimicrobiia bacterium]|nr:nuclear transport factor 2 family protein [Acidimicrobiia bacterium]